MIDCRGHGLSDKPHAQEAYTMEMRVTDVLAVMDDLDIDSAHYWGYSMGGRGSASAYWRAHLSACSES